MEMTDLAIVDQIKNLETREKALFMVFHKLNWSNDVVAFVKKHGGDNYDGRSVASEALIAFDRNIRNDLFKGESSLKTYFISIAKRRWWKLLQSRKQTAPIEFAALQDMEASVEDGFIVEEHSEIVKMALSKIGERCKTILEMYMFNASMDEIAKAMNLANPDMAKKAAYRCRMALRDLLNAQPVWLQLLKGD